MKTEPLTKRQAIELTESIIRSFKANAKKCDCNIGADTEVNSHVISVRDTRTRKAFTICLYES